MYPKVKVRTTEVDDDYECSVIPLQGFNSLSIRDFSPEKERKQLSAAKVPRSYIPRSITPPPSLPKAAKKSGQQTEDNVKSRTRASSIPRPRAVMSSPDNDQILGNRDKTRLKRPSTLKNRNTAPCRPLAQSRSSPSTITVRKPLKTTADSKETAHTSSSDRGNKGSAVDIRVPRAHIVKAKPCFTTWLLGDAFLSAELASDMFNEMPCLVNFMCT